MRSACNRAHAWGRGLPTGPRKRQSIRGCRLLAWSHSSRAPQRAIDGHASKNPRRLTYESITTTRGCHSVQKTATRMPWTRWRRWCLRVQGNLSLYSRVCMRKPASTSWRTFGPTMYTVVRRLMAVRCRVEVLNYESRPNTSCRQVDAYHVTHVDLRVTYPSEILSGIHHSQVLVTEGRPGAKIRWDQVT